MNWWLKIQRWWSLRRFVRRGTTHFSTETRDERHHEFRQYYWSHRLAWCGHEASVMLARMELRMAIDRHRYRREASEAVAQCRRILDGRRTIDRIIDQIEAKRS